MSNKLDIDLLDKVNRGLTEQSEALSAATLAKLQQRRVKALTQTTTRQSMFGRTILGFPFTQFSAAASVCVLVLSFLLLAGSPLNDVMIKKPGVDGIDSMINDVDVLMSNEDMEFLENLEIYEWLDAEYG